MIYYSLSPFIKINANIEQKIHKNRAILFIKILSIKGPKLDKVLLSNKFKHKDIIKPECKKLKTKTWTNLEGQLSMLDNIDLLINII